MTILIILIIIVLGFSGIKLLDYFEKSVAKKNKSYNDKLTAQADCQLSNETLLNLIHSTTGFRTNLLTAELDNSKILFVYRHFLHKSKLKIYKESVALKESIFPISVLNKAHISTTHPKQALALFNLANLSLIDQYKDRLHIIVKENLIILKFSNKDDYLIQNLYSIIKQLTERFSSQQSLDKLIIDNIIDNSYSYVKVEYFKALITDEKQIINTLKTIRAELPALLCVLERKFYRYDLDSAFRLILTDALKLNDSYYNMHFNYSTYQSLIKIFQEAPHLQKFIEMIQSEIVNDINIIQTLYIKDAERIINSVVQQEYKAINETSTGFFLKLIQYKKLPLYLDNVNRLIKHFRSNKIMASLDWFNNLIEYNFSQLDLNLVVDNLIGFNDIKMIKPLKKIKQKLKWHFLKMGQLRADQNLINKIDLALITLENQIPTGGLSISDYNSQGSLSITDDQNQGTLSITETDDNQ